MYLRNTIKDEEFNLTIEVGDYNQTKDLLLFTYFPHPYYYFLVVRPENRFSVFKNEMLKNLPKVITNPDELYIHIRSSDIFSSDPLASYAQPPLCFYKTIINNYIFKKIIIISENTLNPIIKELIKLYSNVVFNKNKKEVDIAYLVYGYNIVGSKSSFLMESIRLNDNLHSFWEYEYYNLASKIYHFHHSINDYKRNYTIFLMYPSKTYLEKMFPWKATRKQINIMLRDKCSKKFKIIIPNNL